MRFTKTILEGVKYWIEKKFSKVEKELENKQPIGDYTLKEDIPEVPVNSVNGKTGDVIIDTFSGSWNDLTDKPFGEEVPYLPGGDLINTTEWTEVPETDIYRFSSKTEKTIPLTQDTEETIVFKYTYSDGYADERSLGCCYSDVQFDSMSGLLVGSKVYGDNYVAVNGGLVDSCDIYGGSDFAVKLTTTGNGESYISIACWSPLATVEILGPTIVTKLPEKFIPQGIARVEDIELELSKKISSPRIGSVGQVITIKNVLDSGEPVEWEAIDPWIMKSSTEGSTKKFKLTIDDDGVLTATEIIENAT